MGVIMKGSAAFLIFAMLSAYGNGKIPVVKNETGNAIHQYACRLGTVYNQKTDTCDIVSLVSKEDKSIEPKFLSSTKGSHVRVVKRVIINYGDSCISLTKATQLPLDEIGCKKLAIKNNRSFLKGNMVIPSGEVWYLVEIKEGTTIHYDWKIPKG